MQRIRQTQLQAMAEALDTEVFQEAMIPHLQAFAPPTTVSLDEHQEAMIPHLQAFAPAKAEVVGAGALRRCVATGVERARIYGVTNPGLLRFYVELMVNLGHHFDTDPLHPWASAILRDPSTPSQAARIDRLFDASEAYFEATGGRDQDSGTAVLRALKEAPLDRLRHGAPGFEAATLETLWTMSPKRCSYLGEEALRALIHRSPAAAARCGLATDRGVAIVTLASFVVGHGFATDPFFPWMEATLNSPRITDPAQRARALERLAGLYLTRALAHFEGISRV